MFQDMALGDWFANIIRFSVDRLIFAQFTDLGEGFIVTFKVLLTFSILIYGLRIMTNDSNGTVKQMAITCVWVVLGIGITGPSFYLSYVYEPILEFKNGLASLFIAGDSGVTMAAAFSDTNSRMFLHAEKVLEASSTIDPANWAIAFSIFVIYGLYYAAFIGISLFCELSLAITILMGIFIIPLSGFQVARGMGKSWVIAVIKYSSVFVVLAVIISLLNMMGDMMITELMNELYINNQLDEDAVKLSSPILGGVLLVGIFGIYMMMQVMEFTTEITGGVMSDAGKGVTSIANTAKTTANAISSGRRVGGSALSALKAKTQK